MEREFGYYNLAAHTDRDSGSFDVMAESTMVDGAMYEVPTRRQQAEAARQRRLSIIGMDDQSINSAVEWAVTAVHDQPWDTGRIATSLRMPGRQINQQLQTVGVNPDKTHFTVSGAPVAWMFLIYNPEFFAQTPTKDQQRATYEEVRDQYSTVVAKIEAAKAKTNTTIKQNGHKNKKNGRR